MRHSLTSVLAAGAAVLAAGCVTPALAGDHRMHVMTVALPNGDLGQIRYYGDVPPRFVLVPAPAQQVLMPAADPFAMLERISALMDLEAASMLRESAAMPLPPGALVSQLDGDGVCIRTVRITYNGGAAPAVQSSTSGTCGNQSTPAPAEVTLPAPPRATHAPGTVEVRRSGPADRVPVRQVAWNR